MPRNDEGEFELVLGNRQLLSVFFVMVILLGVCFAAGYIIGRNSAGGPAAARPQKGVESAIVVDPTATAEKSGAARSTPAAGQVEMQKAAPGGAAAKPSPAERAAAPAETAKPAAAPAKPVPAPPKPAAPAAVSGVTEPQSGQTYLQVAAVRRADADTLVGELRKKEFPAVVAAGPNETLFRVLVGPLPDSAELNKQRARLKELGFDPLIKRY
jgi:DedD protein